VLINKLLIVKLFPSKIPEKLFTGPSPTGTNPNPEFQPDVTLALILSLSLNELEVAVFMACKPYTSNIIYGSVLIPKPV
jgi:hypothetical protein